VVGRAVVEGWLVLVVFNPKAGKRQAWRLWRVLDILVGSGVRTEVARTEHAGHATELASMAAARGGLVVAAGGDGTIAEVAAGLTGSAARLGVIPLGTANVFAHELGLPFAPREVAAALAFGRTRAVRPGLALLGGQERLFVQMLGVGFDAQVVEHLPVRLKQAFGKSAYVMQGLRELLRYRYPPIQLRLDGIAHEAASVIVCKGRLYGGEHVLAAGADPAAPGFAVVMFEGSGPLAALGYGAALPLGLLPRAPGLRFARAARIEILTNTVLPVQADGDAAGTTPCAVQDAPAAIEVVVGS
jgi:YegS/Rv2252/BmrU family lipid kinase